MKAMSKTILMLAVAGIAAFTVSAQTKVSGAGVKVLAAEAGTASVSTPDAAARVSGVSAPGAKVETVTVVDKQNVGKATGVNVLGVKTGTASVSTPDAAARVSGVSAPGAAAGTVTVVDKGGVTKATGTNILGVKTGTAVTTGPANEGTTVSGGVSGPLDGGVSVSIKLKRPTLKKKADKPSQTTDKASPEAKKSSSSKETK